jgi:enamine deaminase RidA (YjgF/YER057c/UK114 family)
MKTALNNLLTGIVLALSVSVACAQTSDLRSPEQRMMDQGILLPAYTAPYSNYVKAVRTGNILYVAGHLPQKEDGSFIVGKMGRDLTVDEGREAARLTTINILSTLKHELGDLNRVVKIIKITGMVNATDSFLDHPKVINGASDLLVTAFGEARGKHTRVAVGMSSLPQGVPVEIEMVIEIK